MTFTLDSENFTDGNISIRSNGFVFEENFSPERARHWMMENRHHGFIFCGMYLCLIFSIKFHMRNKPRYRLRIWLVLWNVALSIFSILGAIRSVPELYHMVVNRNFYQSVCYPTILEPINKTEFWTWLFALSKLPEFGDTLFIVLRKQPLIFLHWYHHITTLLYSWTAFSENASYFRWVRTMNYSIHSFMYLYYCVRATGVSVSKFIMMSITISQIVQMAVGCVIVAMGFYYRLSDIPCQITNWNMALTGTIYFSFLILFSKMFCEKYFSSSKNKYSPVTDNVEMKNN